MSVLMAMMKSGACVICGHIFDSWPASVLAMLAMAGWCLVKSNVRCVTGVELMKARAGGRWSSLANGG